MVNRGSGGYARGNNALGICERCSEKVLRRELVYDGQYPDLLVCPDCWDPKHPQEFLPPTFDPVTIFDPTGDPDRAEANSLDLTVTDLDFQIGLGITWLQPVVGGGTPYGIVVT